VLSFFGIKKTLILAACFHVVSVELKFILFATYLQFGTESIDVNWYHCHHRDHFNSFSADVDQSRHKGLSAVVDKSRHLGGECCNVQ